MVGAVAPPVSRRVLDHAGPTPMPGKPQARETASQGEPVGSVHGRSTEEQLSCRE
jgi:hypothetical protein